MTTSFLTTKQYPYSTIQALIRYYLNRQGLIIRFLDQVTSQQQLLLPLVEQFQPGDNPTAIFLYSILGIRRTKALKELYTINNLRI